jgi:hypothetical protein
MNLNYLVLNLFMAVSVLRLPRMLTFYLSVLAFLHRLRLTHMLTKLKTV